MARSTCDLAKVTELTSWLKLEPVPPLWAWTYHDEVGWRDRGSRQLLFPCSSFWQSSWELSWAPVCFSSGFPARVTCVLETMGQSSPQLPEASEAILGSIWLPFNICLLSLWAQLPLLLRPVHPALKLTSFRGAVPSPAQLFFTE